MSSAIREQIRARWALLALLVLIMGYVSLYRLLPPANRAVHPRVYSELRGLLTGMTIYAQSNQDAFPPPELTSALLVGAGILPPEFFDPPPGAPGEPAFFAIVPAPPEGRWSNSFKETVPLVYSNPAFLGGTRTVVGYSDGHTDVIAVTDLEPLIKASGGQVEPVR